MHTLARFAAAMLGASAPALAQGVTVRGSLVTPEQAALGYGVVSLEPGHAERFTDSGGAFLFGGVPPGEYRLRVRRLGYRPVDMPISVADSSLTLRVTMPRIEVMLSAVRITALRKCTAPGAPDPVRHRELATVFEQLRDNAARYRLAAARHPFTYDVERRFVATRHDGARVTERVDTVLTRGDVGMRYAPGRLIARVMVNGRYERQLHIPTLPDLADSAFIAAHCFSFAGMEDLAGVPHVRVDFLPHEKIREPDITGFALLDRESYQIRRLTLTLTRPRQAARGIAGMSVTTVFREIAPPIVVVDTITAVTTFDPSARGPFRERTELQRLVDFHSRSRPAPVPAAEPPPPDSR